jgi:bacterioferritin-associated ferredoxin
MGRANCAAAFFAPSLDSSERYLCRCLRVTETEVVDILVKTDGASLDDIRALTGAGQGCNSCHVRLRRLMEKHG